jgi:hypothetical protein
VSRVRTLCSVRVRHLCDSSSACRSRVKCGANARTLKRGAIARVKRVFCVRRSRVKRVTIVRTFLCLSGDSALVAATAAAELAETFTSSPQLLGTQRKSGGGKWRWCSFVVCGQLQFILVVVDIRSSAGDGLWQKQVVFGLWPKVQQQQYQPYPQQKQKWLWWRTVSGSGGDGADS